MRERLAILVCVLTLCCAIALSWLFAVRHNPSDISNAGEKSAQAPVESASSPSQNSDHPGRLLVERENCLSCHSVEGIGNPRLPLDHAAAQNPAEELEGWIAGTGAAANKLPAAILRRKQKYQKLSKEEISAIIRYLEEISRR